MISLKRIIRVLSLQVNCCTRWLVYILLFVVCLSIRCRRCCLLLLDRGGHGRRGSYYLIIIIIIIIYEASSCCSFSPPEYTFQMSRPSKRPPAARPPQQQYPPTAYIHSYEASLTYPESGSQTETGGLIKYAGEVQGGCEVWADRWVLLVFLKGWSVYFDIYCVQIDNGGTALYTTALDIVSSLDPFGICRPWRMYISICRPLADHLFYGPINMIHLLTSLSLSLSLSQDMI